ncbi:uncharacterized protein LOC128956198 [Oppia nitens]|uniref:uncharacterized protein LOC128956198 n=1 Tax=Oppia nitens TaxID=1686743 RepID=UPI0023DB8307|nr:uncharacterized protein LOC128956198 [Oppia nitens]
MAANGKSRRKNTDLLVSVLKYNAQRNQRTKMSEEDIIITKVVSMAKSMTVSQLATATQIFQNIKDGSLDLNAAESGVQHKPSSVSVIGSPELGADIRSVSAGNDNSYGLRHWTPLGPKPVGEQRSESVPIEVMSVSPNSTSLSDGALEVGVTDDDVPQDVEQQQTERQQRPQQPRGGPGGPQSTGFTPGGYKRPNQEADPPAGIRVPGQEPLTPSMLAEANPQEQKQMLGERLFPLISHMHPDLAGKITGMLLEIDNSELLHMLEHSASLKAKVDESENSQKSEESQQIGGKQIN